MATRLAQQELRSSLVPAPVAGLASLVIPGLGQILARQLQRGLILLGSIVSIAGLGLWRIHTLGRQQTGFWARYARALDRQPGFVALLSVGVLTAWLWNVWDAYSTARSHGQKRSIGIFAVILLVFFVLGWQIGEINLYTLGSGLPKAAEPLSRVLWPWSAAFVRETETLSASASVLSPCDEAPPPPPPEETSGQPYLIADPTCGELSTLDDENKVVPGTRLHLEARGFAPETETQIWWLDPIGNAFRLRESGQYVSIMTDDEGSFSLDITMPYRLIPPSSVGRMIHTVEARQVSPVGRLKPGDPLVFSIERMIETIMMGMVATFFGILLSIPVSFLAARNLMSGSWVTVAIYYVTRTILNIIRSIEPMIWAIIALIVVGLGPFAGILALTVHSVAALGKLYSEAIESIDPGPIEAIQATGATRLQTIVYGVIPQMIPPFVSFSIYRWDINVRMSTVIGLVGGGGIGFLLIQYIRLLDYRAAGIPVWFIAITVAILDYVSAEIRRRFV
ncbi:MAG: phosphonate ABC transporter, permease protein PhnE [Chloroflexi bacterium]|nr:phosphonate ABC transporter, permease protein PhnE [Chloroflexota bacterium]